MPKLVTKPAKAARIAAKLNTAPLGTVAADQAKRSNVVTKPPVVPAIKPATPTVAKPAASITRTIATIAAQRCNFNELSDRDGAYHAFYKALCGAKLGGTTTVADMHRVATEKHGGRVPGYAGSGKPHDAGAVQRLVKAKLYTFDGGTLKLTADGVSRA